MSYIFTVVITLVLISCKEKVKPISEDEAYSLFNEMIFDDTLVIKEVCEKSKTVSLTDEMKKSFTAEEFEFLQKQQIEIKNKKIKPNKIVYFHKGYKKGDFAESLKDCCNCEKISIPLITQNRKKMLIHFESGWSGSKGDYLYEKKNGRWKEIASFNRIIY